MDFLGLRMFQNQLQPETVPVLADLRRPCIRPVMVTGALGRGTPSPPEGEGKQWLMGNEGSLGLRYSIYVFKNATLGKCPVQSPAKGLRVGGGMSGSEEPQES